MQVELDRLIAPSFYGLHHDIKAGKYQEIWLRGGRGSTKSTFVSIEIILGVIKDERANAVIHRRYQSELRDTVYGQFQWTINRMGAEHEFKFQTAPMQITYIKTGQKIVFKGADDPKKIKSLNLGKGYIKFAWFEEIDQYAGIEEIRNILQSLFRGEGGKRTSFYSYNPPKSGRAWVNQETKIPKAGRLVHETDYRSVPREWLGEIFLADAEHLQKVNETAYRHEYLGEEVGTGLEVFNNVAVRPITDAEIASFDQIRQGLDWGYAAHPLVFERMYFDKKRRRLYIFDEIWGLNISNRVFHEKAAKFSSRLITADSAEPKSIDELKSYGMNVMAAKKGEGSIESGIKFLQDMETIVIDPSRCPLASRQFINYCLEVTKSGDVKDKYPDKEDDSIDAVRYALEDDMPKGGGFLVMRGLGNVEL